MGNRAGGRVQKRNPLTYELLPTTVVLGKRDRGGPSSRVHKWTKGEKVNAGKERVTRNRVGRVITLVPMFFRGAKVCGTSTGGPAQRRVSTPKPQGGIRLVNKNGHTSRKLEKDLGRK